VVFVSLWVTGVVVGRRTDAMKAARDRESEAETADA
jgi:hypothetical protein